LGHLDASAYFATPYHRQSRLCATGGDGSFGVWCACRRALPLSARWFRASWVSRRRCWWHTDDLGASLPSSARLPACDGDEVPLEPLVGASWLGLWMDRRCHRQQQAFGDCLGRYPPLAALIGRSALSSRGAYAAAFGGLKPDDARGGPCPGELFGGTWMVMGAAGPLRTALAPMAGFGVGRSPTVMARSAS
jgi:hypothetical protein